MTTMTDVTFDLLVVEQLHDVVPCRYCSVTAHWVVQCGHCGHACFRCSFHRNEWEANRSRWKIICTTCKMPYPPIPVPLPWRAL